jgi:hypothetical protein
MDTSPASGLKPSGSSLVAQAVADSIQIRHEVESFKVNISTTTPEKGCHETWKKQQATQVIVCKYQ